uniref:Uncharacterized protein n=1 Tax=Guillardia theta TaxID=55529 RepID=A0A7S4U9M5_GUITH|mmetsp:Transcript_44132/g.139256  ORF Transcript_44132/g.139256 Transcript_44132/m.139256 type:complete len:471 (+) Transcript_44132:405-1817(+)
MTCSQQLEDAKTQLFLSSGGFDPAHSPDGQQDHETDEGLLPAKEGEASAVDQPEGSNSDVTGSEDGENAVMRWKTRCLRLERLYQDTRDRLEKASAERQKLEEERALVDSRYDKLHVTYQQANKYIQELEDARRNKDKEFEGLREQLEKYSAANGINTAKKNEEVMTLQAKINSLQDEIASLNVDLKKSQQTENFLKSEKSKLESTIQSITNTLQACKRDRENDQRKFQEKENLSRKEIESLKNSLESTAGKLNALQEEHDKQLAMDKEIVKGLQNDARVKLAEVENALQSSKLTVMEQQNKIKELTNQLHSKNEEMIEIRLSNHHIENGKETSDDGLKEFIHRELEQEELVQQALASIEELLETLGSDNTASRSIDIELSSLEEQLHDSLRHSTPLERRVKALTGLVKIACSNLQSHSFLERKHSVDFSSAPSSWRFLRDCDVLLAVRSLCGRLRRGEGNGYSPVLNPL